jgi:hypothetical protein
MAYLKVLSQHSFVLTEERHEKSQSPWPVQWKSLKASTALVMVHIADHQEMNNRPVEAAVLRRQSHTIIANLPP